MTDSERADRTYRPTFEDVLVGGGFVGAPLFGYGIGTYLGVPNWVAVPTAVVAVIIFWVAGLLLKAWWLDYG